MPKVARHDSPDFIDLLMIPRTTRERCTRFRVTTAHLVLSGSRNVLADAGIETIQDRR